MTEFGTNFNFEEGTEIESTMPKETMPQSVNIADQELEDVLAAEGLGSEELRDDDAALERQAVDETQRDLTTNLEQMADEDIQTSNPGSLKRTLATSLKLFAPDLIGGLIGGLFEGSEGAAAGMQAGEQIRKDLTQNTIAAAKVRMAQARQMRGQQSPHMYDERTGRQATFIPATGQYVDGNGVVIPTEHLGNISVRRQDRLGQEAVDRENQRKFNRSFKNAKFRYKKLMDKYKVGEKFAKTLVTNKTYKEAEAALEETSTIQTLLNRSRKGEATAISTLGIKMAKFVGEVGVMTDTDVERYIQSKSWFRRLVDQANAGFGNRLSKRTYEDMQKLVKEFEIIQERKMNNVADRLGRVMGSVDPFGTKGGPISKVVEAKKTPPKKEMTREDKIKRLKELRAKKGL